jgi:hypothetical protein
MEIVTVVGEFSVHIWFQCQNTKISTLNCPFSFGYIYQNLHQKHLFLRAARIDYIDVMIGLIYVGCHIQIRGYLRRI